MDPSHRSRRAEIAALRTDLHRKGAPLRQIAHLIRSRYRVGPRTAYRYANGLTQQQVADRWNELWPSPGITHKHISYWEAWPLRTGRPPSAETLNRLARIYHADAAELLGGEDHSRPGTDPVAADDDTAAAEPADVLSRVDRFIAVSDTLATRESDYHRLVSDFVEWACRMKRRDILQWLSTAAAAAAAAPVLDGLDPTEQERVALTVATPARVDSTVIGHIEAVLWRCMRQDDALGPQAALETTLGQRNLVRSLLPSSPDQLRDRLLSLYANLSRFAGWLSFDLGNYDAAGSYYETARRSAHEAQDTELGAFVLCNLSHLATWCGQPRTGIDHALAAIGWAGQTGDGRLRAYAFDVAARAYAMDRQDRAAQSAIDQARSSLAGAGDRAGSYAYFLSTGELDSTESACHVRLGRAEAGVAAAQRSLAGIDASFVRNRAMASIHFTQCHLRRARPEVEPAADAFAEAVRLSAHNRSARLAEQLRSGWRDLAPWHDLPAVGAVREQMFAYGVA